MSNNFNIGEKKILSILQKSVNDMSLSFITNIGFRVFFNTGNSFGICSNKIWKEEKKSLRYQTLFKDFYSNELLRMKRTNHNISIRVQGQFHNNFLEITSSYGLGNVLAICRFSKNQICAYYFLAEGSNYNAINDFCNNIPKFEKIVDNNHKIICQLVELNLMKNFSQELLPNYAVQELFELELSNLNLTEDILKKNSLFTKKQSELLSLLASGTTSYKAISLRMKIAIKTVEWHITELKKKVNASTKSELIQFAKKITV